MDFNPILPGLTDPEELRKLSEAELISLCSEIRETLIATVAETGGHLSPNLGVVELTVAIHRVYNTARDRLVFDVGHQSYVHKLLTGRAKQFHSLRQLDGLSGFTKPHESIHDASIAGHASNSISIALGMARARTLAAADYDVVALIGDGALTGGLAYEGLSDAGASGEPMVVILNDNGMSINPNVGGVAALLADMRTSPGYFSFKRAYRKVVGKLPPLYRALHRLKEWLKDLLLPQTIFDELGFYYLGPVDGDDILAVETALRWARELRVPVLLHVITQKGLGYPPAEANPDIFHSVGVFDPESGLVPAERESFSTVFGEALLAHAEEDSTVVAVTAAMGSATGLRAFRERFPERFFDVGIAEGHAAVMSAGLAAQGCRPVFAVYSSFLQRSYDMLIHDIALSRLHVVLAVDRAGLVGRDGETHQGVFDVSFLRSVPGMVVFCPSSFAELRDMLRMALALDTSVAIRYPRGGEGEYKDSNAGAPTVLLREGSSVTLVGYGIMINELSAAAAELERRGIDTELIKLNLITPLDIREISRSVAKTGRLMVVEDVCASGGMGEAILAALTASPASPFSARLMNLGSGVVPHGDVTELLELTGLDSATIVRTAVEMIGDSGSGSAEEDPR